MGKYYTMADAEQISFYQVPKQLISNAAFKDLSSDAILCYAIMRDRMQLSRKNNWFDEQGRLYIKYSMDSVMADLKASKPKAIKTVRELTAAGLIEKKAENGKANYYYLLDFMAIIGEKTEPVKNIDRSKVFTEPVKNIDPNNTKLTKTNKKKNSQKEKPKRERAKTHEEIIANYTCEGQIDLADYLAESEPAKDPLHLAELIPDEVKAKNPGAAEDAAAVISDKLGNVSETVARDVLQRTRDAYNGGAEVKRRPWLYFRGCLETEIKATQGRRSAAGSNTGKAGSPNRFSNFHQREYNEAELEQMLLATNPF